MRIFIRTFGCTLNQSDSEAMAGILLEAGYELVAELKDAELVLFNTCTVKDAPEKRFFSEMKKAKQEGKKVVVAGCVSQAEPDYPLLKDVCVVGVKSLGRVAEAVDAVESGRIVKFLDGSDGTRLTLPCVRKNPIVEIIPISSGCLGECSYCKTRLARGKLISYSEAELLRRFDAAAKSGVKEIWLTSQDSGAYGKDIGSSLPALMRRLLDVEGDYMVRLGMINPNHALEFVDELVAVLKHPRVFKFIHLPVQSGSDRILKLMNRKYSAEDFVSLVERLRKAIPQLTIATDIITGFPTESESEFKETYALLDRLRVPVVNITKFYPRSGTPAKRWKVLPNNVAKRRSSALAALQKRLFVNDDWLCWEGKIIIDEAGKADSMVGRNDYYKPVVVKKLDLTLGSVVKVRVLRSFQHHLEAVLV
jgi:threonylcarbamoyladenosine tRNA methylthiotransferase CDKAL1